MHTYPSIVARRVRRRRGRDRGRCALGRRLQPRQTTSSRSPTPTSSIPATCSRRPGADAVRLGALARLNTATSGGESLFLLGGLFADEWNNGDSFIDRQDVDQRIDHDHEQLPQRPRTARSTGRACRPAGDRCSRSSTTRPRPPANVAEMYFVQAYVENMMAEHYCNGLIFSTWWMAPKKYGSPITTQAAFELALAHADSGLALITGTTANDVKIKNVLQVTKGRILMNLNR